MTDQLPTILVLLAVVAAVSYLAGRRSAGPGGARAPQPEPEAGAGRAAAPESPRDAGTSRMQANRAPASTRAPASPPAGIAPSGDIPPLASARSWGYQLQNLDVKRLAASPFDLLVIDYAKDGSDDTALTPAEVARLKVKPDGSRRLVVAYVSIGEAESYRYYWQRGWKRQKPAWLLGENPEWEENYSVCFWEPGWQEMFCGQPTAYLDRIIAQGFDGIYLDKCDVTEDLREHFKAVAHSRPDLDGDMVAFVERLSAYAKGKRRGFLVIMQNAEPLLKRPQLRSAIDGVAKEELLFGLDRPEKPNSREDVADAMSLLDLAKGEGKPVFVVEYLANPSRIAEAAAATQKAGYVLYVAPKDRELDRISYTTLEA